MRLVVDARWVGNHGIARFASEVLRRLPPALSMPPGLGPSNPLDPVWTTLQIARVRPDVYFSPGFNPPLSSSAPFVFTLHDLIHLQVADESSAFRRFYYEWIVRPALAKAYKVLTVSNFSKQEIVEWSGISPEKIVVVGNGVSSGFMPTGARHSEDRPYLFYIGNRRPHKNLARLLKAFRSAKLGSEVILLCSGFRDSVVDRWLSEAGLEPSAVRFAGEIPEERISEYYRGALAVVMPSLYEGFGLPALEAMACGTPVLTSNCASMPEVVGNCGVLVNPRDTDSIAEGIRRITENSALRKQLKAGGPVRASAFSWGRTADKVASILQEAGEVTNRK